MNRTRCVQLFLSLLFVSVLAACSRNPQKTPAHWQALASNDLHEIRRTIVDAHPGMIDDENPEFRDWVERGYREALALIPGVIDYDTALSAVRYYTLGFRDGHLAYSDNARPSESIGFVAGWSVVEQGGDYVVAATADNWPSELPPVGARWLGCDGRGKDTIIREDVAPFSEQRNLASSARDIAHKLTRLNSDLKRQRRCRFALPSGVEREFDVVYRDMRFDEYLKLSQVSVRPSSSRENSFDYRDGVLWIKAQNFQLSAADAALLRDMLAKMSVIEGTRAIVFDARHNAGGDSGVGDQIFLAATGGLKLNDNDVANLPRTFALWRVSDIAITAWNERLEQRRATYGAGHESVVQFERFRDEVIDAKRRGQRWIEQRAGHRLTRTDAEARGARLQRHSGKVALVTDDSCASSCLNFADLVRRVPGSLHLGMTTSADSVYIDVARLRLPSGNLLVIPMKVWRNGVRGNNEPLQPDIPIDLHRLSEEQLRAQVLDAVLRR